MRMGILRALVVVMWNFMGSATKATLNQGVWPSGKPENVREMSWKFNVFGKSK